MDPERNNRSEVVHPFYGFDSLHDVQLFFRLPQAVRRDRRHDTSVLGLVAHEFEATLASLHTPIPPSQRCLVITRYDSSEEVNRMFFGSSRALHLARRELSGFFNTTLIR